MLICPNCGEENPEHARFCFACGTPLEVEPREREEQRRFVTVVFAELVGLGASGSVDPEDLRSVLEPYHSRVSRVVANHGGTVDKFMGATVLCVFGAPVAHEDDPERGVRLALRIREAVAELDETVEGFDLSVRMGVNTGEAVVARPGVGPQVGEAVTGDVVNIASRLQTAADAGQILVGLTTYEATRPVFEWAEHDPILAKGKAEPLAVWLAVAAHGHYGVDLRPRSQTPLVGRREELAILETTFRRSVGESTVQLLTITGEAGVGKTRLVQELQALAEEWPGLVRWRQGRSLPYGEGLSFWALGEIVKADAGILDSDRPREVEEKLRRSLEPYDLDATEREWLVTRLAPLAGIEGVVFDAPRDELFTAWRRWFETLASDSPFVVVFEDLHWADDAMLAFVEHLVDWTVGLPMLVVCPARSELYDRNPAWGGGRRNSTSVSLSPLTERETAMLLGALLERSVLPAATQAALIERCGGNPLYAEEYVRMLRDRGLLDADGSGPVEATEVPMPQTVQLLIGARIDTLPPTEREILRDAAVIGKVFWAGAVEAVSGLPYDVVVRSLHECVKREFVRPNRTSSFEGQEELAFNHMLVHDVAHGQIPRASRADKHLAVARWIRAAASDRMFDVAELLAHHYSEGLAYARATDPSRDLSGLEAAAGSALMMAGDRAKRLDAARAADLYRRAREVLPVGDPERSRALVESAEASEEAGRLAEADTTFEAAIAEYRAAGDLLGLGEALARRARSVQRFGREAGDLLEEAIGILEQQPPGPELVRAYSRMAGHLYVAGDNAAAIGWADRALGLADQLGVEDEAVLALQYRGAARGVSGDEGGLDDLREALSRGLELGLGNEVATTYNNLAYQLWFWEGPEAAKRMWDEMAAFCRIRGFKTLGMWADAGAIESLFDLGEWDRVLAITDEMREWDRAHGETRVTALALTYRGWVMLRRGRFQEAVDTVEELLPRARAIGDAEFLAPALVMGAELMASVGNASRALELAGEFEDLTSVNTEYRSVYLPVMVRVLIGLDEVEQAEELMASSPEPSSRRLRLSRGSAQAALAEARGELDVAMDLYSVGTREWAAFGFALEEARNHLGVGRCLIALGRTDEARRHLVEARRIVSSLDARPLLEEIDELLVRATAKSG